MLVKIANAAGEAGGSIKPGVSEANPRKETRKREEPTEWAAAVMRAQLSPASRAMELSWYIHLGLAPQALCLRPLRGLDVLDKEL